MKLYDLLTSEEAEKIKQSVLKEQWVDGPSASPTGVVKKNKEVRIKTEIADLVTAKMFSNTTLKWDWLPRTMTKPRFNKYEVGDFYKQHTDSAWMGEVRTDVAYTLFLSDPNDYRGGILKIGDEGFKPQQGAILVYNCGKVHEVTTVVEGTRVCAIGWIHSYIKDTEERELLSYFRKWIATFPEKPIPADYLYTSLFRRWSE